MVGILLSVCCAVFFAVSNIIVRKGMSQTKGDNGVSASAALVVAGAVIVGIGQ